jgi:transglutaminase-like putative cysteine protease
MRVSEKITFAWELRNISSYGLEQMMPPRRNFVKYVKFSPSEWNSWNDIAYWYYNNFFKTELELTDKIKAKARELTNNLDDEVSKITAIYNYVQNLRYVAIQLGDGGIRPSKPEKVLEREYGDCKDKSILLISLLRSLGINAKPVLVLTYSAGTMDLSFPSWNFNHMIVKVEADNNRSVWLDPTVTGIAIGELPYLIVRE